MQACQPRYQCHQATNSLNSAKGLSSLMVAIALRATAFTTTKKKAFLGSCDEMGSPICASGPTPLGGPSKILSPSFFLEGVGGIRSIGGGGVCIPFADLWLRPIGVAGDPVLSPGN